MHGRPLIFPQTLPKERKAHLVGSRSLFLLLNEPALLDGGGLTSGGLALNLDNLALVGGKLAGKVGLLGGSRGLGESKLLDVGVGVASLDGSGLVGLELTEVQVLNGVGWRGLDVSIGARAHEEGSWRTNPTRGFPSTVQRAIHTAADSGGQEGASDRDLLPRGTGEEGALKVIALAG